MTRIAPAWRRSPWLLACLLYVCLTLAYAHPLLPSLGSALPNDTGDPGLNTWILWWNAHAWPLTTKWWNGPIFYPAPGALALSETFLNLLPLSTPLQWAGASAVLTYNILFLLSFPAAALAAHGLARRLTGRHDAALIAGLAFGFAPYRAAQMPHLQMLWSCWMPLALLGLHGYLTARKRRYLWLFGVSWLMNGLATGYYLFFFSVLVALWVLWFARTLRDWLAVGVTAAIASLPLVPLLMGYQHYQSALGLSRSLQEIEAFSANLTAIWATTSYVWPHAWTLKPGPEGELYPGATILGLTIAGAFVAWRRTRPVTGYRAQAILAALAIALTIVSAISWRAGGWSFHLIGLSVSATRPSRIFVVTLWVVAITLFWNPRIVQAWRRRSAFLFYVIGAVLMLTFAMGPVVHLGKIALEQTPYAWLMQLPGGHAFRVPARFGMLLALCLAEAAALAFSHLTAARTTERGSGTWTVRRSLVTAAVCLAVGFEGFVGDMVVAKVPKAVDLAGLDRGAVLLELPMADLYSDTAAMLRATQSPHTLVNGFSGYSPPYYDLLQEGLGSRDDSVLRALQRLGPLLVYVNLDADPDQRHRNFIGDFPDAHRVLTTTTPPGLLFQLPARRPPAEAGRSLAIASTHANTGDAHTADMFDGDLTTCWQTPSHQAAGNQLTIVLDDPAVLSRVELDLGAFKDEYPRQLRISVEDPGQPAVTVWEGRTTGAVMTASLIDRLRMPVLFDLAPPTRGRRIVLTVLDGDSTFSWSIAELKVFGQ